MKQIKFLAIALTFLLMGVSFTSCLDSDSGPYQWSDIVTVDDSWLGVTLKSDFNNYTYTPTNPSVLLKSSSSSKYMERARVILQFAEGEEETEGKTNYKVTISQVYEMAVKSLCNPDTLTVNPGAPFYSIDEYWGANGYLSVSFTATKTNKTTLDLFDMYMDKVEDNTLYVRMNQNEEVENSYNYASGLMSFTLLKDSIEKKYPDLEFYGSKSDSVDVCIVANAANEDLKSKVFRVKVSEY